MLWMWPSVLKVLAVSPDLFPSLHFLTSLLNLCQKRENNVNWNYFARGQKKPEPVISIIFLMYDFKRKEPKKTKDK